MTRRVLALRQKLELRSAPAPTRKIGAALRSRSGIKSESAAPLPLRYRSANCAPVGKNSWILDQISPKYFFILTNWQKVESYSNALVLHMCYFKEEAFGATKICSWETYLNFIQERCAPLLTPPPLLIILELRSTFRSYKNSGVALRLRSGCAPVPLRFRSGAQHSRAPLSNTLMTRIRISDYYNT